MASEVFEAVKTAIDRQGRAFEQFAETQNERFDTLSARLDDLETRSANPGRVASFTDRDAREHKSRFEAWLRSPRDSDARNALDEFQSRARKSLSIGTSADGGYAVPEEIARTVERLEHRLSPVRDLVRVVQVGTGDYKHLINIRGTGAGWVGEAGTRSETGTPSLREVVPTFGELYAYPQTTEWALQDIFFDVAAWLAEEVAQQFAVEEGTAVISGNGTNKPTGMIDTTPVTTADGASPLRAAAAYQYIASAASPDAITADTLITLMYTLNSAYRSGATWVMNSATTGAVRKLKDSQGRYLWTDALASGTPNMLMGYPVAIWEQMQDIGANNFPVAFGDWRRAYLLADRTQLRVTVDDNITTPGRVKYFVRRREGGIVLNNDAAKFIRTT